MSKFKSIIEDDKLSIDKQKGYCKAKELTIVFSFKNFTEEKEFTLENKSADNESSRQFFEKLRHMSCMTWDMLRSLNHKKGGIEPSPPTKDHFFNSLKNVSLDETLYVTRFKGKEHRMFLKRGTKCSRVVYILACEIELGTAYDHD